METNKTPKIRQFKKIEVAVPKTAAGGCGAGGTDPDAPPC